MRAGEPDVGAALGAVLAEGKTKAVHAVVGRADVVVLLSKDRITAGNAARSHELEGKAAIATTTTARVFRILEDAGERRLGRDRTVF